MKQLRFRPTPERSGTLDEAHYGAPDARVQLQKTAELNIGEESAVTLVARSYSAADVHLTEPLIGKSLLKTSGRAKV